MTWYVIGLIGLLLALGGNTPLEHLFNSIPLYGHQRLQSRNMIDVAVAICVLFAGWIDRCDGLPGHARATGEVRPLGRVRPVRGGARAGQLGASSIPASLITSLITGVGFGRERCTRCARPRLIGVGLLPGRGHHRLAPPGRAPRPWLIVVAVFTAADLGLIAGTSQLVVPAVECRRGRGHAGGERTSPRIWRPGGASTSTTRRGTRNGPNDCDTGLPDDNVLARLPSVGGYASIVSGNYNAPHLDPRRGAS